MTEVFRINTVDPSLLDKERVRAIDLISEVVPTQYIYEVGSTAVDGLIGKEDLDFLVRVPAAEFDRTRNALDGCFARHAAQLSNEAYQGYIIDSRLDVAIQLTIEGGLYDTFLVFIQMLRERPDLRDEYNQLKRAFNGFEMSAYREAKRVFIERVLANRSTDR